MNKLADARFLQANKLRIIPLGGIGTVTKNMYLYEYNHDILVVDAGVGFPDEAMPGVDLILPDIAYLKERKEKIRAILLTHGHDDHIAALPYVLAEFNPPVYASKLTAGLIQAKIKEFGLDRKINLFPPDEKLKFGVFTVQAVHVTHSVPDSVNYIIQTPVGTIYHGSDFKFDWTPVDGQHTEVGKIARAGKDGILCLLSDCLRAEKPGYTLSEKMIEETFEREIRKCPGKFIVTTQSSNISRIQQAINVSLRYNRFVCFVGKSVEGNIEVARRLGFITFPPKKIVRPEKIPRFPSHFLTLIVAGSQGQPNSALCRIANNENKFIRISEGDRVVFSADPIPGNENAIHNLIDTLVRLGADVSCSEILDDLHVSGHGAANDLMLMIGLTSPAYLIPIGGTFRQMKHYGELALNMGYKKNQIFLLEEGRVIEFDHSGRPSLGEKIETKNILVDGLGIGDVGNVVLRDRKLMAADGMVVVIVPVSQSTGRMTAEPDIVSRGFVYIKESGELLDDAKKIVAQTLKGQESPVLSWPFKRKRVEEALEKFLFEKTKRRPMILPVIVEV